MAVIKVRKGRVKGSFILLDGIKAARCIAQGIRMDLVDKDTGERVKTVIPVGQHTEGPVWEHCAKCSLDKAYPVKLCSAISCDYMWEYTDNLLEDL